MRRVLCVFSVACLVFSLSGCNGSKTEVADNDPAKEEVATQEPDADAEEQARERQKLTMAHMRTIATAIGAYAVDYNFYPKAAGLKELAEFLEPMYVRSMPLEDDWGTPFYFEGDMNHGQHYTLVSYGHNKKSDGVQVDRQTTSFDCDIAHMDGVFVQWPEGAQSW